MPGVPAQGMAMPGVPAAGGYPAQPYGAYQGAFPAGQAQDPMWGYFTAIAGQVRAASYTVFSVPLCCSCSKHKYYVRMVKLMLKNFKGASPRPESAAPTIVSTKIVEGFLGLANQ